ncbi:MAG: amidohydrolase family protein [Nitrososphaerales archaeon]
MRFVDVQCHIFPSIFTNEVSSGKAGLKALPADANGRRVIVDSSGDEVTFFIEDSPYVDFKKHIRDMDAYNIDVQLLSVPSPSVDKIRDSKQSYNLSRAINDELSRIVSEEPSRFQALATISMGDPELAVEEIERAVKKLGFKGLIISSNTNGAFYDQPKYERVFETIVKHDVPVFMHPSKPVTSKTIGYDYKLVLIFGWPFDTTISISRLAFSGMLSRFPQLKLIAAHGGGMIPFFKGRIKMLARVAAGGGKAIVQEFNEAVLKNLYYDAAVFDPDSLELLVKFAGAGHVLYASDYPFGQNLGKNCYVDSISMMEKLNLNETEKNMVASGNARRIFKI